MRKFFLLLIILIFVTGLGYSQQPPTGLSLAGLPNLSYSSDEGIQYGGRVFLYQYGKGKIDPYKWNLVFNFTWTTKQRRDFFLFFDVPQIFGKNSRFDVYLDSKRFIYDDYYGLGNNNSYETAFTEEGNYRFINENYYKVRREYLALMTKIQFPLFVDGLKGLAGMGLFHTKINSHDGVTKFSTDLPYGIEGGYSNYLQLGVVYDKRDNEAVTSKGFWSEILLESAPRFLGSDYSYSRITLTDRRYFSLHPRLVYAQRLLVETMPGNPPFYEMGFISSSFQRRQGLGGSYTLRGIPRLMFVGPNKFLANFEFRFKMYRQTILKQDFTFYVHTFLDVGKVWLDHEPKNLDHLRVAEGLGLHVRWNKDFVGALDIGRSRYNQLAIYASFGNLF